MTDSVRQSDKSNVTARLKALLKDITPVIDNASEEKRRELLSFLEDLQQSERRKHPRKHCSTPVTYATPERIFEDFSRDISPGGVFIETDVPFSVGHEITLMFASPDQEEPIKITGRIVWDAPKGIGVKFTTPSKDLEAMIKAL